MKDALAIHRWLLAHQVHHEILRLPRSLSAADDLPEILGVPPENCLRVTVFEATYPFGSEPVALIGSVAAPTRPALIAAILGARRVRPAPAFLINSVTDYAADLVCPLLLPDELTVLLARVADVDRLVAPRRLRLQSDRRTEHRVAAARP